VRLSQTNEWRAGCAERRKSGSVRGVEKRAVLWENQSWSQPKRRALLLLYGIRQQYPTFRKLTAALLAKPLTARRS